MQVLITGATGMIGRALVLRLRRDQHQVRCWVRSQRRGQQLLGTETDLLVGSSDSQHIQTALNQADAIVNLAGHPIAQMPWTATVKQALWQSRVDFTTQLVKALATPPAKEQLLLSASAVGFYGNLPAGNRANEDDPPGKDYLARLSAAWETAALAAAHTQRRVIITRIGIVLGHEGGMLPQLLVNPLGISAVMGSGQQCLSWIHLHDLVELMVWALHQQQLSGVLNGVAPEVVQVKSLMQHLAKLRQTRLHVYLPQKLLQAVVGEASTMLTNNIAVNCQRWQKLGFRPSYPTLAAALQQLLKTDVYKLQPLTQANRLHFEHTPVGDHYWQQRHHPTFCLTATTLLPKPCHEVFPFFASAYNLGLVTPKQLALVITNTDLPTLGAGSIINYTLQLGPLKLPWRTRIVTFINNHLFIDAQERGPYQTWWHEHSFTAVDAQTTRMSDRIFFSLPGRALGFFVAGQYILKQLETIFRYRHSAMTLRFGSCQTNS